MQNSDIPGIIHPSWHEHLQPWFEGEEAYRLKNEVLIHGTFYPQPENIFRVFKMPINEIKVVMLGQDPYPQKGQAVGLAFAVPEDTYLPATLKVIRTELTKEYGLDSLFPFRTMPIKKWQTLQHWVDQGVFLFNTALTVRRGLSDSHTDHWCEFTELVIHAIANEAKPIWVLWGAKARDMGQYVFEHHGPGRPKGAPDNRTMSAAHPAAESYTPNKGGFYGCNHFTKVNSVLELIGKEPIQW